MKLGSHINFLGTIGTASILLWGFSQSKAKPDYSPTYIQVRTQPEPNRKLTTHLAPKPQSFPVKRTEHFVRDVTIKNLCKLREYAAIQRSAPKQSQDEAGTSAEIEATSTIRTAVNETPAKRIEITRHLTADVTIKNLCKLRNYAAIEPKEPLYHVASAEDGGQPVSPSEIEVTPFIRDIMNKVRPKQITGTLTVEGKEYAFGSGGRGQSIPYGDYLITPDAVGSWGSRHGAIGVANGTIPDPKLHRDRDGIELHAATNDKLSTDGCVSIKKEQWPEFKKQVLTMVKDNKKVYLHVSDQGASVSTSPLEFIGETISEPTFRDVLSMNADQPARVQSDRPTRRHTARSRLRSERHASLSCGHECRRRHAAHARL